MTFFADLRCLRRFILGYSLPAQTTSVPRMNWIHKPDFQNLILFREGIENNVEADHAIRACRHIYLETLRSLQRSTGRPRTGRAVRYAHKGDHITIGVKPLIKRAPLGRGRGRPPARKATFMIPPPIPSASGDRLQGRSIRRIGVYCGVVCTCRHGDAGTRYQHRNNKGRESRLHFRGQSQPDKAEEALFS